MTSAHEAVREFRKMLTECGIRTGVIDAMLDEYQAGLPARWEFSRVHDTVLIKSPHGPQSIDVCELGSSKAVRLFNQMTEALK